MIRSVLRRPATTSIASKSITQIPVRSLTYVNPGTNSSSSHSIPPSAAARRSTGRGIKKPLESYLICNGITYPGTESTLSAAKSFLGAEFALPDSLVLQTITHKSFAHGLKPYNENLAIIGRHFLRLQTIGHAIASPSQNPGSVNKINFDASCAKISALLSATPATAKVGRLAGLDKSIFWKSPNSADSSIQQPQPASDLVVAKTVDAIVGAVLMNKGQFVAEQFVKQRLLDGKYSLINIAKEIYV